MKISTTTIETLNSILKSYGLFAEIQDGALVAYTLNYTSLNDLLRDLQEIESELKTDASLQELSVELKTYRKIYNYGWEVFMAQHNFINDRDYAYELTGNSQEEIQSIVENLTEGRDFDSEEDKEYYKECMLDALEMNALDVPHIQYYTNNDFSNLDQVVELLDPKLVKHYMCENSGNAGSNNKNEDYYTNESAYIYFAAIDEEEEN